MAPGAAMRGAVAFALVLAGGLAVHVLAAPTPAPPSQELAFGDHADYNVTVVGRGASLPAPPTRLSVQIGPSTTVARSDGTPVLAQPMEFSFEVPGLGGSAQVVRTYWLADGQVVSLQTRGAGQAARAGPLPLGGLSADSSQSVAWQSLHWGPVQLPCGFAMADTGEGCRSEHRQGLAWPIRVDAPLDDLLGSPGPGPSTRHLDLVRAVRSLDDWSAPTTVAALPRPQLASRSANGPAGDGPGPFPLPAALQALASAPADAAPRDLMQRHPDAYLAYARSYTAVDLAGDRQHVWHVVLVGGSERVERAVILEPAPAPGMPAATRVVDPSALDYAVEPSPATLAPVQLAPSLMPDLHGLILAFTAATSREPTGWGFAISCVTPSCHDVQTRVELSAEDLAPAQPSATRWQRSVESSDWLDVGADGILRGLQHIDYGRPVPDLLRDSPVEPGAQATPARTAIPLPSTPAAVTVGLLGLLAGALAAAWPALKVYVPLFTRIEASRVLDHPMRRRVHDLVHAEPGIHSRQVALRLGIAGNTASHHLDRLVGAGYLGERHIAGYHCYFPRGGLDERLQDAVPILKSRGAQAVLLAVETQGAPSFRAMMAVTGLGYATVHHHADRLWRAGLLSTERDGKARRFRLTELGRVVADQARTSLGRFPKLPKNDPGMDGPA